jgi:hypothetical protein
MSIIQGFETAIAADFDSENRSHNTRAGRTHPNVNILVHSAMHWANAADLAIQNEREIIAVQTS